MVRFVIDGIRRKFVKNSQGTLKVYVGRVSAAELPTFSNR